MAGNTDSAKRAAQTRLQRYGADTFKKMGQKSWQNPNRDKTKQPFAANPELAREAGRKGGKHKKVKVEEDYITAEELHAIAQIEEDGSEAL